MLTDQRLAPPSPIRDFVRALNAQVVCFRRDLVAVEQAVRGGFKRVDGLFNMGAGGELFDAGFLYPRIGVDQAPWFTLTAEPVRPAQ